LRRSQGFEVNDLGYLQQADQQSWNNWFGVQAQHPSALYQQAWWNFNWWQYWTAAGTPVERAANTNGHVQLHNGWFVMGGVTAGQLGTTFCDRNCSRGGPAVRVDPYLSAWGEVDGDARPPLVPYAWFNFWRGDGGRSRSFNGNTQVTYRIASQVNTSLTLSATHNVNDIQWFGNFITQDTTHYTFAHLDQKTVSLTGRVDYTLSTTLTLQLYVQPFVAKGSYSNVRELADANAAAFVNRYKAYADTAVTNHPGGFNDKEFNSTTVLRWEYRPGSTLFLVWTQGRSGYVPLEGTRSLQGDFRDMFDLHPNNTFIVKASYWIN
jgi:hypothetical protein